MSRVSPSLLTGCFHTSAIWLNRSTPNQPPALTVEPEGPCYCQKLQKRHPVVVLEELVVGSRQLRLPCLLGKGLQDGIHLLGHGCQCELKLLLCLDHAWSLVPQVLQGRCDINLFSTFGHLIENHVNQDVGSTPARAVTAMNNYWTRAASVALVYFSAEVQE